VNTRLVKAHGPNSLPFGICFDLMEKTIARDFVCGQNNIVTNACRLLLYLFVGNNVDVNSSVSFRKSAQHSLNV
jgi:hypothetical protein